MPKTPKPVDRISCFTSALDKRYCFDYTVYFLQLTESMVGVFGAYFELTHI